MNKKTPLQQHPEHIPGPSERPIGLDPAYETLAALPNPGEGERV